VLGIGFTCSFVSLCLCVEFEPRDSQDVHMVPLLMTRRIVFPRTPVRQVTNAGPDHPRDREASQTRVVAAANPPEPAGARTKMATDSAPSTAIPPARPNAPA
jgi:hypothetical protein